MVYWLKGVAFYIPQMESVVSYISVSVSGQTPAHLGPHGSKTAIPATAQRLVWLLVH
jgi:hypothetical protein